MRFSSLFILLISSGLSVSGYAQEVQPEEKQDIRPDSLSSLTSIKNDSTVFAAAKSDTPFHHKTPFFTISPTFNKKRFALVSASTSLALVSSYFYVKDAWWSDRSSGFHFDGGRGIENLFTFGNDLKYAKNLDKFGHFYGGIIYSDLFSGAAKWSGMPEKRSLVWGGILGTVIQGFVEVKDGYSPNWGFSVYDLMAGSLGSFYPYFQYKSKILAATDVKLSYYKRNDYYFKYLAYDAKWNDDYMNQTYWFTFNPKRYNSSWKWPKWLGISAGIGVDNKLNNYYLGPNPSYSDHGKGGYEFFIAPDIDFKGLLPKRPVWQKIGHILNYVKFPAPTLRLSNDSRFYLFYF